ncbi:MAG: hypothetical protein QF724_13945, partial [Planctomycetota bacterium]|nr:hypothetical protein [Planctomycetota bacterium]
MVCRIAPRFLSICSLFASALLAGPVLAQGADDCANAQAISGAGSYAFNNSVAMMDGLPDGLCDFNGSQDINNDVWFALTTTETGTHTLSICGQSSVDTKVAVYDGACGAQVLACDDDSCGLQSELEWEAIGGAEYILRIGTPATVAYGGSGTFTITFVPDPLGQNYCTAAVNSTGAGAVMNASGSVDIDLNNLVLHAQPVPAQQMGVFFYGPAQLSVPFGDGYLCVGSGGVGQFRLYPPLWTGTGSGSMSRAVDYTNPPQPSGQITVGSTWNFQAWYRDPAAGGSGFNLSDGYEILFQTGPGSGVYDGMALV